MSSLLPRSIGMPIASSGSSKWRLVVVMGYRGCLFHVKQHVQPSLQLLRVGCMSAIHRFRRSAGNHIGCGYVPQYLAGWGLIVRQPQEVIRHAKLWGKVQGGSYG